MNPQITGIVLVIIAAIGFSTKSVVIKLAYEYQIDAISLLALRMGFSAPFFLAMALFYKKEPIKSNLKAAIYIRFFFVGLAGYYLASFFDFKGLQYISAGVERLILFTYPTLVILLAWPLLKRKPGKIQLLALLLVYLGIAFVVFGDVSIPDPSKLFTGSLWVFMSALCFALYLIGNESLIPLFGAIRFTSWSMLIASIAVFIHAGIQSGLALFEFPWQIYAYAIVIALISTLIPSYLFSAGIKRIGASTTAIVGSIGPVSTLVLAYFVLEERISEIQLIGTVIVLAGVGLISLIKAKKGKQKKVVSS